MTQSPTKPLKTLLRPIVTSVLMKFEFPSPHGYKNVFGKVLLALAFLRRIKHLLSNQCWSIVGPAFCAFDRRGAYSREECLVKGLNEPCKDILDDGKVGSFTELI